MTQLPGPFEKLARAMDEQTPPAPAPEERRVEAAELMRRAELEKASARGIWRGAAVAAALLLVAFAGWFLVTDDGTTALSLPDSSTGMTEQWPEAGTRYEVSSNAEEHWRAGPAELILTRGDAERGAVEVLVQNDVSVELTLESGELSSNGNHSTKRWAFTAGPFQIAVLGTHFTTSWTPETGEFSVELHEGVIELSGPGLDGAKRMRAGERFDALVSSETAHGPQVSPDADSHPVIPTTGTGSSPDMRPVTLALLAAAGMSAPSGALPLAGDVTTARRVGVQHTRRNQPVRQTQSPKRGPRETSPAQPGEELPTRRPPVHTEPEWMALSGKRQYGAAWELAEKSGLEHHCVTLDSGQLLELADTARYARQNRQALEVLRCVRDRFPDTSDAATAAYLSGRVLGNGAQYDEAASFYQLYLTERPFGPLAREALGRLLETRVDAGQERAAIDAARRYLESYPNGPHAGLAEQVLLE